MENIYIILVEPIYKGNIGSVARIMHNFEFYNLRIVGSIPQKEDYVIGVHSDEIMTNAQIFGTLPEATKDLDRVIALSRRTGNKKKVDLTTKQLGQYVFDSGNFPDGERITDVSQCKIGLVFGRETFGLNDDEAELCDLRCHITANEQFPSLNLAQAVAVILYEIYKQKLTKNTPPNPSGKRIDRASKREIDDAVNFTVDVLDSLNIFQDEEDKNEITHYLHTLMYRTNPNIQMTIDLKKLFNRIHLAHHGKGKGF
jgi:TrmH family RNA methyltransferase